MPEYSAWLEEVHRKTHIPTVQIFRIAIADWAVKNGHSTPLRFEVNESVMATMNQIREAMHAQPFRPFILHLINGRTFRVKHPDFIAVANIREMVFVGDDEGIHNIELPLVIELEIPPVEGQATAQSQAKGNGE